MKIVGIILAAAAIAVASLFAAAVLYVGYQGMIGNNPFQ